MWPLFAFFSPYFYFSKRCFLIATSPQPPLHQQKTSCGLFLPVDGDKALWDFLFSHFNTTLFVFIYSLQKCVFSLGCILFKNQHFKSVEPMWRMTSFITLDYNQSHFLLLFWLAPLQPLTKWWGKRFNQRSPHSVHSWSRQIGFDLNVNGRAGHRTAYWLSSSSFLFSDDPPSPPPPHHPLPLSSPQWQQIEL